MTEASPNSLKQALGAVANAALTFAGVGVFSGLFALYGFSMGAAGPAMVWGWPLTVLTAGALVLVFSQLASHFPYAGSMYQWPMMLVGKRVGWAVGWIYLAALFPLMTAYYATLPLMVKPLFGWADSFEVDRNIILFVALFSLLWNLFNVRLLGKLAEWGMILEILVSLGIVLVVFALGPKDFSTLGEMSQVVVSASGQVSVDQLSFGAWVPALFGGGIFVSYWVMYTFENGGTLGEETKDASRNAPKGILGAFAFAAICGFLFLFLLTASLADPRQSMINGTPAEDAISLHLPVWAVKLFLFVLAEGLVIASSTMFAGATRHLFGMARDNQIPFAALWTKTNRAGSPWAAGLLLTVLSLLPVFVFKARAASMVGAATAAMYVAYFLVATVTLFAVLRGWPHSRAVFHLGRLNLPVTVFAAVSAGFTAVNLLWARASTNPTFDQISGEETTNVLRHIPMAWYIVGVPILLGAVYYVPWSRKMRAVDSAELIERDRRDSAEGVR